MKGERLFAFRWDVDHRVCVTDGLPAIRAVCREFAAPQTFFINMGRSTNLLEWLRGAGRTAEKLTDYEAVHLIAKTGWPRFLLETLLARPVGLSFPAELAALAGEGHELGLHGGMDHVVWSRRFAALPDDALARDVETSLAHFTRAFGRPAGFTSPGFRHDARVAQLVDRLGFAYTGDAIGGAPHVRGAHWVVPVTLSGPRTIPFFEYHGARRTPEPEVWAAVDAHLDAHQLVVVYGHPCYEGVRPLLLRELLRRARDRGFRFVTLGEITRRLGDAQVAA